MAVVLTASPPRRLTRRRFLQGSLLGAAGLALYAGEIERHWIEITRHDVGLRGLASAFDGMRIAQISDIHMEDFTEPAFLRHAVKLVNREKPDAVFMTGDFVTALLALRPATLRFDRSTINDCAEILAGLECKSLYAVLGNHDHGVGAHLVSTALRTAGITVLRNTSVAIERGSSRFWLAGVDDPLTAHPQPDLAIPEFIRNQPNEPVILLCHGPDYADNLLAMPAGQAVDFMLSGHSHGGQVRLPFYGACVLPPLGKKYVEGFFNFGRLQLYVNRGLGTIGLPFRFDCPPEISIFTLRPAATAQLS
jgi:predicted MPP superfamily phosphohydrolase